MNVSNQARALTRIATILDGFTAEEQASMVHFLVVNYGKYPAAHSEAETILEERRRRDRDRKRGVRGGATRVRGQVRGTLGGRPAHYYLSCSSCSFR